MELDKEIVNWRSNDVEYYPITGFTSFDDANNLINESNDRTRWKSLYNDEWILLDKYNKIVAVWITDKETELIFYWRLASNNQSVVIRNVFKASKQAVEKPQENKEKGGLLNEIKTILETLGLTKYWNDNTLPPKKAWKDLVTQATLRWEQARWQRWKNEQKPTSQWPQACQEKHTLTG